MKAQGARPTLDELASILRAFAESSSDAAALCDEVVHTVAAIFGGYCSLLELSADGAALVPMAAATHRDASAAERDLIADISCAPPTAAMLASGEHVLFSPLTARDLRAAFPAPAQRERAEQLAIEHAMLTPLRARGATIGCLLLVRYGALAAAFDAEEIALAHTLADHVALSLTNARVVGALRLELEARQLEQDRRQMFGDLAREFAAATADVDCLLALVAQRLGERIGEMCTVRLVREDVFERLAGCYDPDASRAPLWQQFFELVPKIGIIVTGRTLATNQPLRIDAQAGRVIFSQLPPPLQELTRRLGIRAAMSFPFAITDEITGLVTLWRRSTDAPYTDDDEELVAAIVSRASLAIANARTIAETRRELEQRTRAERRLRVLTDLVRELSAATEDADNLLVLAARRFVEIVGDGCVIRRICADGTFALGGGFSHVDPAIRDEMLAQLGRTPQRTTEGLSGKAAVDIATIVRHGTPDEIAALMAPGFAELARSGGITSVMTVPMISAQTPLGVITMFRAGDRPPYTDDERDLMTEVAIHTALAVHTSQLIESLHHELAERRRTEAALTRSEAQLRHAQKMEAIGRLAGGVAHDFNNILSVIMSCASFALDAVPAGQPIAQDLESIQKATMRAAELTRQLLAFSRQQIMEPVVLDIAAVVTDTEKMIRRVIGEDIELRVTLGHGGDRIKFDPGHLVQVIMNLAVNARDAMPNGGRLEIETSTVVERGGRFVKLSIRDDGVGMDAATQQHVFEPYFTTKEQGKGTGLGLPTVLGIVEQSGGRITLDSAPGRGTRFDVLLPCTTESPRAATGPLPRIGNAAQATVLLVEDDDQVSRIARRILEREGMRILLAASGAEALEVFAKHDPEIDLVLTDVVMPGMNGRELVERLQAIRPDLRVLYMSGYTDEAITRVLTPDIDLIQKPFTRDALVQRVRTKLGATTRASSG